MVLYDDAHFNKFDLHPLQGKHARKHYCRLHLELESHEKVSTTRYHSITISEAGPEEFALKNIANLNGDFIFSQIHCIVHH